MLSSITTYLFGSSSPEAEVEQPQQQKEENSRTEEDDQHNCHLKTKATDDEWVLVDTSDTVVTLSENETPLFKHLPSGQTGCSILVARTTPPQRSLLIDTRGGHHRGTVTRREIDFSPLPRESTAEGLCSPKMPSSADKLRLTTIDDHQESGGSSPLGSPRRPTVVVSLTRSADRLSDTSSGSSPSGASTPVHVVYPSMEESWLVTPPPCFTAGGRSPSPVETGPMENLLIEHPSMSVYGLRGRQSSAGVDTDESESDTERDVEDAAMVRVTRSAAAGSVRQPPRRARAVAACAGLLAQVEANRSMQVVKQRQEKRSASRNKLGRSNKVTQYQSQNKHMRRKHYMLRPSGCSNNRRC